MNTKQSHKAADSSGADSGNLNSNKTATELCLNIAEERQECKSSNIAALKDAPAGLLQVTFASLCSSIASER